MKGFKPTGYGPSAGFKFPASYGFTGSTGAYTNVQPYVRMKPRAFKDGGYVSKTVGDAGHALVQRDRPTTNEDQQSGGKSPLRRGFKKGGRMKKANGGAVSMPGALSNADREYLRRATPNRSMTPRDILRKTAPKKPAMGMKGKFAAADGGSVPRRSKDYSMSESIAAIPKLISEKVGMIKDRMASGQRTVEGRRESVDERVTRDATGASNYAKGGMAKVANKALAKHVNTPAPKGHKGLGAMCK